MSTMIKGACLCQSVTLTATANQLHVDACHCSICRTWGGGPLMGISQLQDFHITGSEHVKEYHSSEWASRGFCQHCGTHLYFRLHEHDQYFVPAGLISDESAFSFHMEVFIEEKPSFYAFANDVPKLTGEELFKLYSSH